MLAYYVIVSYVFLTPKYVFAWRRIHIKESIFQAVTVPLFVGCVPSSYRVCPK